MEVTLKNKDIRNKLRTELGGIHLFTEVHDGKFAVPETHVVDSTHVDGIELGVHTGYDYIVFAFGNHKYVKISTRNNGDPIKQFGWRYIAHTVALHLTGKDVVAEPRRKSALSAVDINKRGLKTISKAILEHIDALVCVRFASA